MREDADKLIYFMFKFMKDRMTPKAFEQFISAGIHARGSKSLHGMMLAFREYEEASQKRRRQENLNAQEKKND